MLLLLATAALLLSLPPALHFWRNLSAYSPPRHSAGREKPPAVSVLIPARNEEQSIGPAIQAVLASRDVELELLVLDDHSTDATAAIVSRLARHDARLRLHTAPQLPRGWCGKQHACWSLAKLAQHPLLLFLDADVRVAPDGIARTVQFHLDSGAKLVSGVPHQETGTLLEKLLIPLIHFVLLGFLPLRRMRASYAPAFGAGCGQLFLAERDAYMQIGGHQAVRESLHDGVTLPRAFRSAGVKTDLFDATDVATCRMYRSAAQVWNGLAKNAVEGLAAPTMIVPATLLLVGGQILPMLVLLFASLLGDWLTAGVAALALAAAYSPRMMAALHFRQSWLGAVLHPLAIALFLVLQWYALLRWLVGRPATWKERPYLHANPSQSVTSP